MEGAGHSLVWCIRGSFDALNDVVIPALNYPCVPEVTINKKFWEELIAYFPWYDTGHIENDASNNSSVVACVLVTAVTFLPSRCLATTGGIHNTHTHSNVIP
jgi:hypothetical protein